MPRDKVLDDLINRTEPHEKTEHKPKYIGSVDIPDLESPLADVETRHLVYSSLLSKLTYVLNTAVFLIYTHCFRACREIRFLMTL